MGRDISVSFSGAMNLNSGFEFQALASIAEQAESWIVAM